MHEMGMLKSSLTLLDQDSNLEAQGGQERSRMTEQHLSSCQVSAQPAQTHIFIAWPASRGLHPHPERHPEGGVSGGPYEGVYIASLQGGRNMGEKGGKSVYGTGDIEPSRYGDRGASKRD